MSKDHRMDAACEDSDAAVIWAIAECILLDLAELKQQAERLLILHRQHQNGTPPIYSPERQGDI